MFNCELLLVLKFLGKGGLVREKKISGNLLVLPPLGLGTGLPDRQQGCPEILCHETIK